VDWIRLDRDNDQYRTLLNIVVNLHVFPKVLISIT